MAWGLKARFRRTGVRGARRTTSVIDLMLRAEDMCGKARNDNRRRSVWRIVALCVSHCGELMRLTCFQKAASPVRHRSLPSHPHDPTKSSRPISPLFSALIEYTPKGAKGTSSRLPSQSVGKVRVPCTIDLYPHGPVTVTIQHGSRQPTDMGDSDAGILAEACLPWAVAGRGV